MGIVDFRRRGSHYECTTVSSIKQICERVIQIKKLFLNVKDVLNFYSLIFFSNQMYLNYRINIAFSTFIWNPLTDCISIKCIQSSFWLNSNLSKQSKKLKTRIVGVGWVVFMVLTCMDISVCMEEKDCYMDPIRFHKKMPKLFLSMLKNLKLSTNIWFQVKIDFVQLTLN